MEQSPFGRLPEGVSAHIFSCLSEPKDLYQCQATCRSWKSLIALARPCCLEIGLCEDEEAWLAKQRNLVQDVREITFYFQEWLIFQVWDIVLVAATRLEVLILEFWDMDFTLEEDELAILPHSLTSMCFRGDVAVTAEAWASIPSGIHLRKFEFDCSPEASASLPSPLPACMASLTCLCLSAPHDPSFALAGCPRLQQLKLMFRYDQRVASWEPLTHHTCLRDLSIESGFDLLKAGYDLAVAGLEALPVIDLDRFPALQNFSGQHCAGVKGHVHSAYIDTGYVTAISLKSIGSV